MRGWLWCFMAVITVAGGIPLNAQVVTVRLVEEPARSPVVGAIVSLVGAAGGSVLARHLSGDRGMVRFAPVRPGWYRIRVERIGHRRFESDSVAVDRPAVHRELVLEATPTPLQDLSVEADNACGERALEADGVVTLWDEIRTALLTSRLINQDQSRRFRVVTRHRTLDPNRRVRRSRSQTAVVTGFRPFQAVASEQLAQVGYIQADGLDWQVLGPDEDQLLSPHFAATHCFSIERSGGSLGLGFRPIPSRSVPDIAGVMWIDRSTRLPRAIEFGYTNVPKGLRTEGLGGRAEFVELPGVGRFIARWQIRVPYVETRRLMVDGASGGQIETVGGFHEDGGEATPIAEADTVVVAVDTAVGEEEVVADSVERKARAPSQAGSGPRPRRDRDVIVADEWTGRTGITTALDAVRQLRPTWLRPTRPSGRVGNSLVAEVQDTTSGLPAVYVGTAPLSGVDDLAQYRIEDIVEIRYLPAFEALRRRPADGFGAIIITLRDRQ